MIVPSLSEPEMAVNEYVNGWLGLVLFYLGLVFHTDDLFVIRTVPGYN